MRAVGPHGSNFVFHFREIFEFLPVLATNVSTTLESFVNFHTVFDYMSRRKAHLDLFIWHMIYPSLQPANHEFVFFFSLLSMYVVIKLTE